MASVPLKFSKTEFNERILPPYCTVRDDIVISGISGIFPDSYDLNEFATNLYNGVNCVNGRFPRWPPGKFEEPKLTGNIPTDFSEFDSEFFGYTIKEANNMSIQSRIALEHTHSAILDSGNDPDSLRGSNTGVFMANVFNESVLNNADFIQKKTELISHSFDFRGSALSVDTACASTVTALHQAMVALRTGQCDAAIVVAVNIMMNPYVATGFYKLSMTSNDCKCKTFDADANGYARSEAIGVMFLQKIRDAKRIYSIIRHSKSNHDGYKPEGITFPNAMAQVKLITEIYDECGIDPLTVKFIESHTTGTKAGDPTECKAMSMAMRKGKHKEIGPLMVGAVKSNIGHSEAASGMCAIAKVIIAYENKMIPKNINLKVLNPDIPELHDGSLLPITENTPFDGGIVSVNNFGFGGANVHVIMESPNIEPNDDNYKIVEQIPRLVLLCGRTFESVKHAFKYINSNRSLITREFLSLINDISHQSRRKYRGMPFRGSMILHCDGENEPEFQIEETYLNDELRPLFFIFTGIGSQWSKMDLSIMKYDIFEKTINKLSRVLQSYDIDLVNILAADESFLNIINYFISIITFQIAFVDLLIHLGIKPKGIIGYSIGEIVCAYADGILSAEETILTAYCCGKCIHDLFKEMGLMAEVGLSIRDAKEICPLNIDISCNNSDESVVVSGPHDITVQFVDKLRNQNIFVRKLLSCDVPLHSSRMEIIRKSLTNELNSIGIKSKSRSKHWISTSCDDSSPADINYFINNLIKPVMFYEAIQRIPKNACVIEISPHSSFENIIKNAVGSDVKYISMMNKYGTIDTILSSIGQLYGHGYDPQIEKLYPRVEYPVSRGTPFISPLIKWDHSIKHYVPNYDEIVYDCERFKKEWKINLNDEEYAPIADHVIDDRILFPGSGYLFLVWKTLAYIYESNYNHLPIQFEDVSFNRVTIMTKDKETKFIVHYFKSSGKFEIVESDNVCVSGRAFVQNQHDLEKFLKYQYILNEKIDVNGKLVMNSKDFYKELRIRGYDYGPSFQCVHSLTINAYGNIKSNGNWSVMVDSMLQLLILSNPNRNLMVPKYIELMRCDPRIMNVDYTEKIIKVVCDVGIVCAAGIEIKNMQTFEMPRKIQSNAIVYEQIFVPYDDDMAIDEDLKVKIEDYIIACQSIVSQIERRLGKDINFEYDDMKLKKYLLSDNNKYAIIKILNEMKLNAKEENNNQLMINKFTENIRNINNDIIFNDSIYCMRMLQPLVELSFINYLKRPLNILEINNGFDMITPKLIDIMTYNHVLDYRCTVAHSDNEIICKNPNIQIVEYNLKIGNKENEIKENSHGLIVILNKLLCGYDETSNYDIKLILESAYNLIDDNGFILVFLRYKNLPFDYIFCPKIIDYAKQCEYFIERANEMGLLTISKRYNGISTMAVLLRKPNLIQNKKHNFISVNNQCYDWIEKYKNIHKNLEENEYIWLLANDKHSGVIGMANCVRFESKGDSIRCVYNEQMINNSVPPEIIKLDLRINVFCNGKWGHVTRILPEDNYIKLKPTEHAFINIKKRGDLSSFAWFEAPHKYWPNIRKGNEILIKIYYSALNFKDIMIASGRLNIDAIDSHLRIEDGVLGLEFSGKNENGDRVMGIVSGRGIATTFVIENTEFLWSIPNNWTMEEACTVPIVYATSYYALLIRAKLKNGESVLIHSGTGGVGQSAIEICLSLNCDIFTTVGSHEKRDFIKMKFPKLKDDHILNSRDTKFESQILEMTNGRGVDVVLNSLSEDILLASVRCLATNGRFCEIGKFDSSIDNQLDLSTLIQNKTFHGVHLDIFFNSHNFQGKNKHIKMIQKLVSDGIANGVVKPLNRTVFDKENIVNAFRFMSTGKHTGKVVIKIRDENDAHEKLLTVMAYPNTFINPHKSVIITGGLGGFGLEVAQWLVERGARKLILTSRTGPKEPYQIYAIERMKEMGADVRVWKGNGTSEKDFEDLLTYSNDMGPITGIFHLAMIFRGALLLNLTIEDFSIVVNTKILQAQHLDRLSRRMCPQLDYFVIFSSIIAAKGYTGHSSYAFGNSACERICESRRNDGFHGLAIQWGTIGDVGIVAEVKKISFTGLSAQRMPSCFAILNQMLQYNGPVYGTFVSNNERAPLSDNIDLIAHVLRILEIESGTSNIDPKTRLSDLGMDSLNALEIRNAIRDKHNVILHNNEIRNLTIADLKKFQNTENTETQQIDVLITNEPIIKLNSVKSGKPIFFLQSTIGMFKAFRPVAEKLMRPVYGLNWTVEFNKYTDLKYVAEKWIQMIEEIEPMDESDIIGYSYGGIVLLEMAFQWQKRNRKIKNLILIDIGNNYEKIINDTTFEEFYINIVLDMLSILSTINYEDMHRQLSNAHSNDERHKIIAKYVTSKGLIIDEKTLIAILDGFWVKALMIMEYKTNDVYNGDVILMRASELNKNLSAFQFQLSNDYGLSEIITGKCETHVLEGNHFNIIDLNVDKIAEILNNLK